MYQRDSRGFMKDADIMRELRRIRYSSRRERQARRARSILSVAAASGVVKNDLYSILAGKRGLTDFVRERLSIVLGS